MAITANQSLHQPQHLDFKLVLKGSMFFGAFLLAMAVFNPDPVAFAAGAIVPALCLRIVYTPTMPAAVIYLFVWQWLQIFARLLQTWIDGETLSGGLGGPSVLRAYWYMLASLIVLAIVFRLVLSRMKPPTQAQRLAHYKWTVRDVGMFYVLGYVVSMVGAMAGRFSGGLAQPGEVVGYIKVVALFTLFVYCMSTGRGRKLMLGVILFEVGMGFTGFLSDFRSVFIFLGIAAVVSRVRWGFTAGMGGLFGLITLTTLALFWTSVKMDYREWVTGGTESQAIVIPLSDRMAYLGDKALHFGDTNFGDAAYSLLLRFAYVDIFGSVIDVQEQSPEVIPMRQWKEALSHVFQPRVLFPDKPDLIDSEVYARLTRRNPFEAMSAGTSISVGYMGENFADLGFPAMLAGVAALGAILAGCLRVLMSFNLPQVMREGIAMAFAYGMCRDGVEVSLPKMLGAALMFFIIFGTVTKFGAPRVVNWLNRAGTPAKAKPRPGGARRL